MVHKRGKINSFYIRRQQDCVANTNCNPTHQVVLLFMMPASDCLLCHHLPASSNIMAVSLEKEAALWPRSVFLLGYWFVSRGWRRPVLADICRGWQVVCFNFFFFFWFFTSGLSDLVEHACKSTKDCSDMLSAVQKVFIYKFHRLHQNIPLLLATQKKKLFMWNPSCFFLYISFLVMVEVWCQKSM